MPMKNSDQKLCVVHANCQGETLLELLAAHSQFPALFQARQFTNYIREPVPDSVLSQADVFVYQHLGPEWGDLASERLLTKVPRACHCLCMPNMYFMGYWPLIYSDPNFNYSDLALDALLERGLPKLELLRIFLKGPILETFGPWERVADSLEKERAKEARASVNYLDDIWARFKDERLFHSVNHPAKALLRSTADAVLDAAGLRPLTDAEFQAASDPYDDFELPIHPYVAQRQQLSFAGPDTLHRIYNRTATYAAFAERYVDCKLAGQHDFISYLQVAA